MPVTWTSAGDFEDIRYELSGDGIAKITIDRPEVRNAFRPQTRRSSCREAFELRPRGPDVGVDHPHRRGPARVLLRRRPARARRHGLREPSRRSGVGRFHVTDLHVQIRRLPKPVVAMVAGYAIGGGHVLHVCCDLTIAADNARFGQTGPRVGSFDGGFGASLLRGPDRPEARQGDLVPLPPVRRRSRRSRWGLVNAVVPLDRLEEETVAWCREMLALSPFALRLLKASFHAARGRLRRASSSSRTTPTCCSTPPTRRARAARPTRPSARRTSRSSRGRP